MLELRISGPGLDVLRALKAGDPELVLGRDADCGVCLPDPQRNVSRRHLSLWLDNGELNFRVLSVVNGVEMPFGEAPPGARGVLPPGQTLKVGDYSVCAESVEPMEPAAAPPADPWAVFEREGSGAGTLSPVTSSAGRVPARDAPPARAEEDPFEEWEFEASLGPHLSPRLAPRAAQAGDLAAFFRGLGLDPASVGALGQGEVEGLGRLTRMLLLGVLQLYESGAAVKEQMHAEDRTMVAAKDNNPLKTTWPEDTKLRYLFGGRAGSIGFPNPERALGELLLELLAHSGASASATRAALESTLKEFAPATLKTILQVGGAKLFEGARAWNAYCKYHARESQDLGRWAQRLLDRYYSEAYLRESARIKRDTPPPQR
jgi:predicted component of type VI protein secretion system